MTKIHPKSLPIVAIVGRPNVGKSTLFNRLVGRREALVFDEPGVTRDRRYGETEWDGFEFTVVDTGGLEFEAKTPLKRQMSRHALKGIEEAQCVILLMDGRAGVTALDREWVERTRKIDKPKIFVVNKIDSARQEGLLADFYSLGIDPLFTVSSETGRGVGDLLDRVVEILNEVGATPCGRPQNAPNEGQPHRAAPTTSEIRVAIIGRPNVGKSTLLNRLLGEERAVVDDLAGTTKDPVDSLTSFNGKTVRLIDTAGIRRKGRIMAAVEKFSIVKALEAIERSTVCLLVLDSTEGITQQDAHVAGEAAKKSLPLIILINKWDEGSKKLNQREFGAEVVRTLRFASQSPLLFISAKTGRGCGRIFPLVISLWEQSSQEIEQGRLIHALKGIVGGHPPPTYRGRDVTLGKVKQVGVRPPTFVVFSNAPDKIHFSYERYLNNSLRETFGFKDVPIKILFRKQ